MKEALNVSLRLYQTNFRARLPFQIIFGFGPVLAGPFTTLLCVTF